MDMSLQSQIEFARKSVEIRRLLDEVSVDDLESKLDIDNDYIEKQLSDKSIAKQTGKYQQIPSKKTPSKHINKAMSSLSFYSADFARDTFQRTRSLLDEAERLKCRAEGGVTINKFEYKKMKRLLKECNFSLFILHEAAKAENNYRTALYQLWQSTRETMGDCFCMGYQEELTLINASVSDKIASMVEQQTKIAENSRIVANRMDIMTKIILVATIITTVLTLIPFIGSFAGYLYQFGFTTSRLFSGLL